MMVRHHEQLFPVLEELGVGFVAADIALTMEEVKKIDEELDNMKMSEVFGDSPVKKIV